MVLSQISNKVHRFQQITKQVEVNVQRKANGKNDYVFWFPETYMYFLSFIFLFFMLAPNIQYFVNKL